MVAIGPLNLVVSFYLAFRLALKAQNINDVNRSLIHLALRRRLRSHPLGFFLPPRTEVAPPAEDVSDIEAAWTADTRRDAMDEASRRWAEAYLARTADGSAPADDPWERGIAGPNAAAPGTTEVPATGGASARQTDPSTP
ncbi:Site-specific recombinase [compost metagenome]